MTLDLVIPLGDEVDPDKEDVVPTRSEMYEEVARQANLAEAGGLAKERAILLLWFLRNVVGVDELEAYDLICDGDLDQGIDGIYIERATGEDGVDTLVLYQSKYGESPGAKVGSTDIDRLHGATAHFASARSLQSFLAGRMEPSLRKLIGDLGIQEILANGDSLSTRLVIVTSGELDGDAKRKVEALKRQEGSGYIDVWDLDRLGPLADAVRSPERISDNIGISFAEEELLVTGQQPTRVAVLPVSASLIAGWPGIESRQLFALNVRHELRANRVSKALDAAIARPSEHADFLAYHNGLTIVCDSFDISEQVLTVRSPSVVNGAQSAFAFQRAQANGIALDNLRVLVKVVEVEGRPVLEKEVARRSNTQTGVNPRNLMANHGTQLRLTNEFEHEYPNVGYETRPDTVSSSHADVIANDDAAQLLCAVVNEWPELAVKRNVLFDGENYPQIFSERIHAHHIVFVNAIKEAVQAHRSDFPNAYRESWLLTRITACYLVGQILREAGAISNLFTATKSDLESDEILKAIDDYAFQAAVTLARRHEELGDSDDFRKDFKNQTKLKEIGASARSTYRLSEHLRTRDT